jgi:hypothetical protein
MEHGAVPGYKDRPTGPVTLYSISADGGVSRTLNRAERMAEAAGLEKEVAKLEEDLERNRPFPVIDVLEEIDQMIEGRDWAYYLHDEVLNKKVPRPATPEFIQQAM